MSYPAIKTMPANPMLEGMVHIVNDVVFSMAIPQGLRLSLLMPWSQNGESTRKQLPLIVFVQGSGWGFPNIYKQIPQLCQYARRGYVVATVTHRNAAEGHAFPAYLQDVKTAIRFLRAHAAEYGIDTERVCVFGTSSGGNTALLVGLTGDEDQFRTEEYPSYSDAVQLVVECFGPTNLEHMLSKEFVTGMKNGALTDDMRFIKNFRGLFGDRDIVEVMRRMSPVRYISTCAQLPPTLIIHGDADDVVPYAQGVEMYEKLHDAGGKVEMIRILGAPHEGSFWSDALHTEIQRFIDENLL